MLSQRMKGIVIYPIVLINENATVVSVPDRVLKIEKED